MSLNESGVDEADTDQFQNQYVKTGRLPLGRAALPEEVAETVLWLGSRANSYTTGQTLVVDGGLSATF
jgi:NAD(P)-dependent dehydrogenase (short-subunit alcohol dehydrogenase family)